MSHRHDEETIQLSADFPVPHAGLEGLRQDMLTILQQGRPLQANDLFVIEKLAVTGRELVFAGDPKARLRNRSSYHSQNNSAPLLFSVANTTPVPAGSNASTGDGDDEPDEMQLSPALAPSTNAETFGVRALRELVAKLTHGAEDPMVGLLTARKEARTMGLQQLEAAITAKIHSLAAQQGEWPDLDEPIGDDPADDGSEPDVASPQPESDAGTVESVGSVSVFVQTQPSNNGTGAATP